MKNKEIKMKIFTKILIVVFFIIQLNSITKAFDSAKFHKSDTNQVYYIENEYTHDWFQALTACARLNMTLLTIDSKAKSQEVNQLVLKTFGKNVVLWVGGYAVGPSHQFTWIATGDPFVYTFWNPNQPDFHQKVEFCAQIGWGSDMRWNDHGCGSKFGYICENRPREPCTASEGLAHNQKYANMTLQFNYHA